MQHAMEELLKNFSDIAADVKSITVYVHGLRQQLEDFREHLDSVKRRLVEPERVTVPSCVEVPQANKGGPPTRLADNGIPLLVTPQTGVGFHTVSSSPTEHEAQGAHGEYVVRNCRHDFPRFSGNTSMLWLHLCLTYFDMYKVPEHHWVSSPHCIWMGMRRCGFRLTSDNTG